MTIGRKRLLQGTVSFGEIEPFQLEFGGYLRPAQVRFALFGEPKESGDNVVLVCHALSGSARVDEWWPALFAMDGAFSDDRWCVVGMNIFGSCYGSSGPTSIDPQTGKPFGGSFPQVTIGDSVRAQAKVLDWLGVERLHAVVGSSIGGMQALEWALRYPERVKRCVAIGATPLNALGLGLNHIQREAIRLAGPDGLGLARQIGMCTYKSPRLFDQRHGRRPNRSGDSPFESADGLFDIAGYLAYQGESFVDRFDPTSYKVITRTMDLWDPEREHGPGVWQRIKAATTLIGISTDWLFPAEDVRDLATKIRSCGVDCDYREQFSDHGHDAFLAEPEFINETLRQLLNVHAEGFEPAFTAAAEKEEHNGAAC